MGRDPDLYLIPSTLWLDPSPPLVSRDYEGLNSAPEYGLSITKGGLVTLEQYRFEMMVAQL